MRIFLFLIFLNFAESQYQGCDFVQKLSTVGRSIPINYPVKNNAAENCRYQVIAPVNSVIEASCSFDITGVIRNEHVDISFTIF